MQLLKSLDDEARRRKQQEAAAEESKRSKQAAVVEQADIYVSGGVPDEKIVVAGLAWEQEPGAKWDSLVREAGARLRKREVQDELDRAFADRNETRSKIGELSRATVNENGVHASAGPLAAKAMLTKSHLDRAVGEGRATTALFAEYRSAQRELDEALDHIILLKQDVRFQDGNIRKLQAKLAAF